MPGETEVAPQGAPPALHSHTPADGHVHLQHGGVVPLQGSQAVVQVGGHQVEEADHQGQDQQRPLPFSGHGTLLGRGRGRGSGHHRRPLHRAGSTEGPWRWGNCGLRGPREGGGGGAGWQHLPPARYIHPWPQVQTTQEGAGRWMGAQVSEKEKGNEKTRKENRGEHEIDGGGDKDGSLRAAALGNRNSGPCLPGLGTGRHHADQAGQMPAHWQPILIQRESAPKSRAPGAAHPGPSP